MEKETYWSRHAGDYERNVDYVVGSRDQALIKERVAALRSLGHTLELGCGSGIFSELIANAASHLTATDYSDEMVAAASCRLSGMGNVTVEKADCRDLDYPAGGFDTVLLANLLHVIDDPRRTLAESRRVIKPGGTMVVISYTTAGMRFSARLGMIYRYLKTWGKPPAAARTLTPPQTCDMLAANGFRIIESALIGNRSKAVFIRAEAV